MPRHVNHDRLPPIPGPVASSGNLWRYPKMRRIGRIAVKFAAGGATLGFLLGLGIFFSL